MILREVFMLHTQDMISQWYEAFMDLEVLIQIMGTLFGCGTIKIAEITADRYLIPSKGRVSSIKDYKECLSLGDQC